MPDPKDGMLSPYRVLDLTDEIGQFCGKLLGDLGADVIKVEPPEGDPGRKIGPFLHDQAGPDRSLYWLAFNTSKRGITLDLKTGEGCERFKKLAETADIVAESFQPGYLDSLGLGFRQLEQINPRLILVSISPFGQSGPYRDFIGSGIVSWALGGYMYPVGQEDRAPVQISHHPQAYLQASIEGAVGALVALMYRQLTGKGQHVDVSVQECLAQCTWMLTDAWDMVKLIPMRGESKRPGVNVNIQRLWACRDGFVIWAFWQGTTAKRSNEPLIAWMESERFATGLLSTFDWAKFDLATIDQETVDRLSDPVRRFLAAHTITELLDAAARHNIMLYPIASVKDIIQSNQLKTRNFWGNLPHPENGEIKYPGSWADSALAPTVIGRPPPTMGEHNREVFEGLGKRSPEIVHDRNESVNQTGKPLAGIRIIDLTWNITGPMTTKPFASFGAEVIRVEGKTRHDRHRAAPPFKNGVVGLNRSGCFNHWNTGKMSVAVDLSNLKGIELTKRLVAKSDVVIENFAGKTIERLGLGYEELRKANPEVIMISSNVAGQTGPHVNLGGWGIHLAALSGFSEITGWPDRNPELLPVYTDFTAPRFNALVMLSAIEYKRRTGKGQYVDMSQYQGSVHLMAPLVLDYLYNGRIAHRLGNRSLSASPHGAFRCCGNDRWCALAVTNNEQWRVFCRAIGSPPWASDSRFQTFEGRKTNEDELERLVESWTMRHGAEEVMTLMQAVRISAGVVQNGRDILENDLQLRHRHSFWEIEHPEIGLHHPSGPSFILSKTPCEVKRAPLLGEHNEYVCKEILGMSDDEVAELVVEGVLE